MLLLVTKMTIFNLIVCFSIIVSQIVIATGSDKVETSKRNERDIAVYPVHVNKVDDSVYRLEPSTLLKMMKPNVNTQTNNRMRMADMRADEVYNERNDIVTDNSSSVTAKTEDDYLNTYELMNKKFEENLNIFQNILNTLNTSSDRLNQIADSIKNTNVTVNKTDRKEDQSLLPVIEKKLNDFIDNFNKSFTNLIIEINAIKSRLNLLTSIYFDSSVYGNQDRIYYTNGAVSYQLDGNGNLIPVYKKLKQRSRDRQADIATFVYEYNLLFFKVQQRLGFLNDTLNEPEIDLEKLDLVIQSVEIISKTLKEPYFNLIIRHKVFYGKKLFSLINDFQNTIHNDNVREYLSIETVPLIRKAHEVWQTKLNLIRKALTNLFYDNDTVEYNTDIMD